MSAHLITGARGLIGGALARALKERQHLVAGVDDGSSPTSPWRWCDRQWTTSVEDLAVHWPRAAADMECVWHCASPVGPTGILRGGSVLTRIIDGTRAALLLAARAGVPVVVFSSSEVHGRQHVGADGFLVAHGWSPRREYQVGKLAVELLAARHYAETGLPTAVVRPWNITGVGQDGGKGFVFPRFAEQARTGEALTVYGDGLMRRAFMDVDDAAEVLIEALGPDSPDGMWRAEPMEMASPQNATSIVDLARMFGEHPLAAPRPAVAFVDPVDLHGPSFQEASSGSKLPPDDVPLRGKRDLASMVDAAMRAVGT